MTQHPIHTLSPPELRGYARGLRETAALLGGAWSKSGMVPEDEMSLAVQLTREAWEREAELVEGFAARLDDLTDQPRPVTRERVESWVAKFEPPIQSFRLEPLTEREIRQQDLANRFPDRFPLPTETAAELETLIHTSARGQWYEFSDVETSRSATLHELFDGLPPLEGYRIISSEWQGERWATAIDVNANTRNIAVTETADQLKAVIATTSDRTPEEKAQTGLADAVAENLAEQPDSLTTAHDRPAGMADDILRARREKAKAAFLTGEKPKDIARQLGIPEGSINSWASKYGWRKELAVLQAKADPRATVPTAHSAEVVEKARVMFCIDGLSHVEIGNRLGVPAGTISGWASKRNWTDQRQPHEEAPQPPPAAPIKPTPAMLPEDKAEAREKLRTGEFKGAAAIMEEYGCTQDEAQALVDEHRNRMGKAA